MALKYTLWGLVIIACYSCLTKGTERQSEERAINEMEVPEGRDTETTVEFCDTTKIKDFKSNLRISTRELSDKETEYQTYRAKEFITNACKRDTLFCGEIIYKKNTIYEFQNEWKLLITGYVFDEDSGMEVESASFFVLTIMRNDEVSFTGILEDLIGEIQVELNGFEEDDKQITVWGHSYPYFQNEYGKFRLTIKNGSHYYEFQCHAHS